MTKVVKIHSWLKRKGRSEQAFLRGFIRWKRLNKRLMNERDHGTKRAAVNPRQWAPPDRPAKS